MERIKISRYNKADLLMALLLQCVPSTVAKVIDESNKASIQLVCSQVMMMMT